MKKKIALATLAIMPLGVASANATGQTGVVTASSLNIRSGPSTNYSVITTAKKGEEVTIIDSSNGWYKVKLNSGKEGWASGTYISKVDSNNQETSTNQKKVIVNGLNMRSGAGTSYRVICVLKEGTVVDVISESNGWVKIKYDGRIGYASGEYLQNIKIESSQVSKTKEVNTDVLNVRSGPGTNHSIVGKLKKGQKVDVLSEANGWSKINYNGKTSYISSSYLSNVITQPSKPDADNETNPGVSPDTKPENPNDGTSNGSIAYNSLNYTLKDHIARQVDRVSVGGNVIDSSKPRSSSVMTTFMMYQQSRAFIPADTNDIEYFLNPQNFTKSAKGMMQFLKIDSYKEGISEAELNSYLNSLAITSSGTNVFYNQGATFINAAKKYNIDLAYLVSHAMWETGYGKSTLSQGQTITSFKGEPLPQPVKVYNFYGIGAIDKNANVSGAEAAYSNGWTSVEATIDGSAQWISSNYIKNTKYNQNTIYKMKWNYDYTWHQYATDVNWANGMSGIMDTLVKLYDSSSNLTFEVPKYK